MSQETRRPGASSPPGVTLVSDHARQLSRRSMGSFLRELDPPRGYATTTLAAVKVTAATDDGDDWRMTEHSPNVAMGMAGLWADTARMQVARVLDPTPQPFATVADAYQAVFAIRRVRRAAGMALEYLTDTAAKAQLREALDDFDRELPHVTAMRDALEHFDEYTRGIGNHQQPDVKRAKRLADEALAEQYRAEIAYLDDDRERPMLCVGPPSVDLVGASTLASMLKYEIWAAIRTEEGKPVSREWLAEFHGIPARMAGVVRGQEPPVPAS